MALRNAADARMNTSRIVRPSHSSLSLSVMALLKWRSNSRKKTENEQALKI
jgi:hypothetical protein